MLVFRVVWLPEFLVNQALGSWLGAVPEGGRVPASWIRVKVPFVIRAW